MAISASELLSGIAHKIYGWQTAAFESGISLGEEAITDFIMLELLQHTGQVKVCKLTKHKEAQLGADFDLVLVNDYYFCHFVVQAKRLFIANKYQSLTRSKGNKQQCARLQQYAVSNNATPLYFLYNTVDEDEMRKTARFKSNPESKEDFGCTVCACRIIDEFMGGNLKSTFGGINAHDSVCLLKDLPLIASNTSKVNCGFLIKKYPLGGAQSVTAELRRHPSDRVLAYLEELHRRSDSFPRLSAVIYDSTLAL